MLLFLILGALFTIGGAIAAVIAILNSDAAVAVLGIAVCIFGIVCFCKEWSTYVAYSGRALTKKARNEKMAQFYEQCLSKGYTDMQDDQQSLKAKVIASDLGLRYGNIESLFQKAKACYEEEQQELDKQRELEAKRSVPGKLLFTLEDIAHGTEAAPSIKVFRRPDGTIYRQTRFARSEGLPPIKVKASSGTLLSYNPSQIMYAGASVGGVTTGGFYQTKDGISVHNSPSGKGDLVIVNGSVVLFRVIKISFPTDIQEAYKRDPRMKAYADYSGVIRLFRDSTSADNYSYAGKAAMASGNMIGTMNALSLAADEKKLPIKDCQTILSLLMDIAKGNVPPTDDEIYQKACELRGGKTSAEVKQAADLFTSIGRIEEARQTAEKYEELLQQEKEAAILKKEARRLFK